MKFYLDPHTREIYESIPAVLKPAVAEVMGRVGETALGVNPARYPTSVERHGPRVIITFSDYSHPQFRNRPQDHDVTEAPDGWTYEVRYSTDAGMTVDFFDTTFEAS